MPWTPLLILVQGDIIKIKKNDHLSNLLKKTRLGSHYSEKIEFLRQIQRKKPTCAVSISFTGEGDSDPPSKGASLFSSMGDITVDPKGVAKLLDELHVLFSFFKIPKPHSMM